MGHKQSKRLSAKIKTNSEEMARMDQRMADLEEKTFELEQAARAMSAEKAEYEQKLADMSKTTDKHVLEKMEIQKVECEQRLAVMSQTVDKLVQEKMETHKEEYEQKLALMRQTIDRLVQEKAEEKARMDQRIVALRQRNIELEKSAQAMSLKYERELTPMAVRVEALVVANREESKKFQKNLATLSKKIDLLPREKSLARTTAESVDPITVEPTASGSHDPSSVQSNIQEEVRQPPPEQTVKKKKKKRKNRRCEEPKATPDELSLDPGIQAEVNVIFRLLSLDDRLEKIKGLELMLETAQYQPELLIPVMEKVCMGILWEVMNQGEPLSSAALWTLTDLFLSLKSNFEPYLVSIIEVLLQKATTDNRLIRRATNVLLGRMIRSCSPLRCVEALLGGLSNQRMRDPGQGMAVRECVALHLLALVRSVGPQFFHSCEGDKLQHILSTVNHLTLDASEVIRDHFSP